MSATRCDSTDGVWQCIRYADHAGPHLANFDGNLALRWGMRGFGCCDPWCVRRPNHPGEHNDGNGVTWWPIDEPETP